MALPDIATLQAGPEALLDWLEGNILDAGTLANVPAPDGLAWVTFEPRTVPFSGPVTAVDRSGNPMGLYQARTTGTGPNDAVRAFICNYAAKQVRSVDLDNRADYCFTTNLNGCTFGIGPAAPNGSRRVSHANSGGVAGPQRTQTYGALGTAANDPSVTLLEPSLYKTRFQTPTISPQATVFGIRSGLNWKFYFQCYFWDKASREFTFNGIAPL